MLLVHLSVVSCHSGASVAHGGHVRIARGAHHRHALSGVHVEITCGDVLRGLVGMQ